MPPGTPKAMVDAVRRGFDETMRDPAFLEEAKKVSMDVDPLTGAEMQQILEHNYAAPKALVERAAKLLAVPTAK
jgi:tripartite-type tricarboxylate transporter receptor subunit TctC